MADASHGADAGHAAESAGGMPQLDFTTFPSQIFWLLAALIALYFIISKVALPQIVGAIEERHDAIEDDLDRAAEFKRRAEQAEAAYDKALADAKAKANEIAARTAESEAKIAEIRDSAMASVEQVATDTAQALVDSFMPGAADEGAVRGAVQTQMNG